MSSRWKSTMKLSASSSSRGSRLVTYVPSPRRTSRMLTRDSARTASRSELRESPSSAARSASRGSRSPARSAPEVIMPLIFSMASSVTATVRAPPLRKDRMFVPSMAHPRTRQNGDAGSYDGDADRRRPPPPVGPGRTRPGLDHRPGSCSAAPRFPAQRLPAARGRERRGRQCRRADRHRAGGDPRTARAGRRQRPDRRGGRLDRPDRPGRRRPHRRPQRTARRRKAGRPCVTRSRANPIRTG